MNDDRLAGKQTPLSAGSGEKGGNQMEKSFFQTKKGVARKGAVCRKGKGQVINDGCDLGHPGLGFRHCHYKKMAICEGTTAHRTGGWVPSKKSFYNHESIRWNRGGSSSLLLPRRKIEQYLLSLNRNQGRGEKNTRSACW